MTSDEPTDTSDTPGESGGAGESAAVSSDPTPGDRVAALQLLDTEIDQLVNRRERLPEREALAATTQQMKQWESRRSSMRTRLDELSGVIERAEAESADLLAHRQRLEAQMKTVIAPREAEALMHEMSTLDEQRDGLDTVELEALEEQATLDDELTAHLVTEGSHRDAMSAADDVLADAVSEIDTQIAALTPRRDAARSELSETLLAKYDRVRASSGVAVAKLVGHRCEGCHLDLSAAEVDDVKDEAAASGGIADCPQCGRMLVV